MSKSCERESGFERADALRMRNSHEEFNRNPRVVRVSRTPLSLFSVELVDADLSCSVFQCSGFGRSRGGLWTVLAMFEGTAKRQSFCQVGAVSPGS